MNRAMFSGVAGLKTHQTRMDVIGNNIANVNTVGYKSQTALFSDLLYQNSSNASGPNADTNVGGINAKQVGLGAKMASINTNITLPGSAETTNNPFDIRLTGDSFFIVNNGTQNMFTRDGSFKVDAAGNLVMSSNGYMVQGWLPDPTDETVIKQDTVQALQIMNAANMTYPAAATTQAYVSGIVDAESPEMNSESGKVMNLNFYDDRGYAYTAKMAIKRVKTEDSLTGVNSYSCELVTLLDSNGKVVEKADEKLGGDAAKEVELLKEQKKTIDTSYKILTASATSYTIQSGEDTGERWVYEIKKGTAGTEIVGTYFKDAADTAGTTFEDLAKLDDKNPLKEKIRDPWTEVAKMFGYTDVDTFKSMKLKGRAAVTADPTKGIEAKPAVTEQSVKGDLAAFLSASGVKADADSTASADRTVTFDARSINGLVINFSKADGSFKGLNTNTDGTTKTAQLTFATTGDAASFKNITIDFSTLKNVGNEKTSTAGATAGSLEGKEAGRMIGKMSGLTIGTEGKIYATYDNGQSKLIGQIAVARFANPAGLQKAGDNLYTSSQNSGEFDGIGVDVTSDGGKMTPGELEMSNVDLSGELTGMIVTQRGFQANSRIITVSDTMLEELINLKR